MTTNIKHHKELKQFVHVIYEAKLGEEHIEI